MNIRSVGCIALFAMAAAGCAGRSPDVTTLEVPGSSNAHVTLASEGATVVAAWAVSGTSGADIYFASSRDGGAQFDPAVRVNDVAGEARVSGEQPPRVVMRASAVHVLWVAKLGNTSAIRVAQSEDGGRTFSPARTITPSGIGGARGWESAAVGSDGAVHVAWLDGRSAEPQAEHHHHGAAGPAPRQDVFHAALAGLQPVAETRVAANVCFCCKTAIVARATDVYVAWRHLLEGGVRDIAIARSADGGRTFGAPVRVSADNWKIDACPDDGPAMAFDSRGGLHVVWPTLVHEGGADRMAIFHAVSTDGGATFSARERVDGGAGANAAHPRAAARQDGSVAIVWDEMSAGVRHVAARTWSGGLAPAGRVLDDSKASSYPAITATATGYVTAWTEQSGSDSRIVVARVF